MPTEEQKTVDIDTSGPGAEIDVEEKKDESVIDTEAPKQETETTDKETDKTFENERETKLEESKVAPRVLSQLTGPAWEACKHLDIDEDIAVEGV